MTQDHQSRILVLNYVNKSAALSEPSSFSNVNNNLVGLSELKIYYTNCDCLTQIKFSELLIFVHTKSPDILALTEIFPKNYIFKPEADHRQINGYELYTSEVNSGRGVCIYTKSCLNATFFGCVSEFRDQVQCQIKLLVGCIYRSPNGSRLDFTNMVNFVKTSC